MPHILVVDDEPDVVSFIQELLQNEGWRVDTAYDGISALDIAQTQQPDIILLDIMMPMMSGYEVCEQLKADPSTRDIPVVCLSSAHSPNARARSLQAGAQALFEKPFLPAELIVQLQRHLKPGSAPERQD